MQRKQLERILFYGFSFVLGSGDFTIAGQRRRNPRPPAQPPVGSLLSLAERMHSEASLTPHELSPQRRHRLKNVLRDYVPEDTLQRIRVTGLRWFTLGLHHPDRYDAILPDGLSLIRAPCIG